MSAKPLFFIKKSAPALRLLTPAMTSNTTPAPFTIAASSAYSTSEGRPFYAFNQSYNDSGWITAPNSFAAPDYTGNQTITVYLGGTVTFLEYIFYSRGFGAASDFTQFPRSWTVAVSDDGANFTVVDTRNDEPLPTANKQRYAYTLSSPARGCFIRVTITKARRDLASIGEIELYGF